ncbi:membrane protein insertion efficiency factor YidD [Thalassiella azotivora]
MRRLPRRVLVGVVRLYQLLVSPLLGPTCRFYPSCSAYAVEALQVHGAVRGSWLAARRLGRCHPWNPGGVDLVPPREGPAGPGTPSQTSVTGSGDRTEDDGPATPAAAA